LIRSRGLRPGKDIQIVFTGARHGERLSEDLLGPGESWKSTANSAIREVVTPVPENSKDLDWVINRLTELAAGQKSSELTRALRQSVWAQPLSRVREPAPSRPDRAPIEDSIT